MEKKAEKLPKNYRLPRFLLDIWKLFRVKLLDMTSRILNNPTFLKRLKADFPLTLNVQSHKSLIETSILERCFISIVIPVRDEADYLLKTLDSLIDQTDFQNLPLDSNLFEVIVLANNCYDSSAEIVKNRQKKNPNFNLHCAEINLPKENANVGFVRRLLMNEAFYRLKSNKFGGGIIATTDGDTRAASDWIINIAGEIEKGADAVGGRILIDENEFKLLDDKARNFHLLDEEYRLLAAEIEDFYDQIPHDLPPRHHQHFNGSFAVTTDAFARAGGVPDVKFLEDAAFYNALLRNDAKVRHSPNVKVFTSARNRGRTALGLSTQLNEWEIMGKNGDVYLVESAQTIEKRLTARRELREFWRRIKSENLLDFTEISTLAEQLCIPNVSLLTALKNSETFGILMEKIIAEQNANDKWKRENPLVSVEDAISDLQNKLAEFHFADKSRKKTA